MRMCAFNYVNGSWIAEQVWITKPFHFFCDSFVFLTQISGFVVWGLGEWEVESFYLVFIENV